MNKLKNKISNYNLDYLKQLIANNSVATVISILALFVAFSSSNTPCLSANSVCTSGTDPEYTNNLSVKAGTTQKATITHNNLIKDNTYFFPESHYSNTSSIAVLKKGTDQLNILDLNNGSIILGQSLTSTIGGLRVQTSSNPVLQMYGLTGWQDIATTPITPTNDIGTVAGDTGSFSALTPSDTINIVGSGSVSTAIVGDTLTISSSGGGTPLSVYGYVASAYTPTGSGTEVIRLETEYYDTGSCFTFNGSPNYTITYTCSETKMFQEFIMVQVNAGSNARMGMVGEVNGIFLNEFLNSGSSVTQNSKAGFISVCLNQNDYLEVRVNSNGQTVEGGFGYSQFQLNEIQGVDVSGGCTDGKLD